MRKRIQDKTMHTIVAFLLQHPKHMENIPAWFEMIFAKVEQFTKSPIKIWKQTRDLGPVWMQCCHVFGDSMRK